MADIDVKEVEPMTVMALPFTGDYNQTQSKLDHLMSWLLRVGHPRSGRPLALYHDDPEKTPTEEQRAEVCLPIKEECEGEEDIVRKDLPGVKVAYTMHEGPYSEIPEVYEEIFDWMEEKGYEYDEEQPTREVFHKLYGEVTDPEEYLTEIQVPLKTA
jgi:AraC family transcriptional regulator